MTGNSAVAVGDRPPENQALHHDLDPLVDLLNNPIPWPTFHMGGFRELNWVGVVCDQYRYRDEVGGAGTSPEAVVGRKEGREVRDHWTIDFLC